MVVPEFEYHRPATVAEACALLADLDGEVAALAGGTELILELKNGDRRFDHLVALSRIDGLRTIELAGDELVIGAMVTPGALARSDLIGAHCPEIAEVASVFAARQVGNRATVGGNIATAVPSADFPPLLIALGAACTLVGPGGMRAVKLEDAFVGPRQSLLKRGELFTSIHIPVRPPHSGARYLKFGLRGASVCAVAGVAAAVTLRDGVCASARIALGAVAPVPLLVSRAGAAIEGRTVDAAAIAAAARIAREECAPIGDIRGSAEYRRELVETLTTRALLAALERARSAPDC